MKVRLACALCLILGGASQAQVASDNHMPPGLVVLGLGWSRHLSAPRFARPAPPPFDASRPAPEVGPRPRYPPADAGGDPFPPGGRLPYTYVYSLRVRNEGAKAIKAIAWEHVFADPGSGRELGRQRLAGFKNVGRQKGSTLSARLGTPPSNVVSIEGLGTDKRSPYIERAALKCVLYADGSTWESPGATGAECEGLRRRERWRR